MFLTHLHEPTITLKETELDGGLTSGKMWSRVHKQPQLYH